MRLSNLPQRLWSRMHPGHDGGPRPLARTAPGGGAPPAVPYRENPPVGPVNLRVKLERVVNGGPFEWPNIVALNQAVAQLLGDDRRIVELGSGTGRLAIEAAVDPARRLVCSEFDTEAHAWAVENRPRPNVRYVNGPVDPAREQFDVAVAIEVVEHVADYGAFLHALATLAPRAIVTTPNRRRNAAADHAGPPVYEQHVREWSAGEFYWVLRAFWREVRLRAMPDEMTPRTVPVDIDTRMTPLIADCRGPIPWRRES